MNDQKTEIQSIIVRQLDGSASVDEKRALLQWLKASEANREEYREVRDLWLSCGVALQDGNDTGMAFNRMMRHIQSEGPREGKKKPLIRWYHAAAVILILLVTNYWFATHPFAGVEKELMIQNRLITAKGSKGHFVLPDGSLVWLNSESMLVYPEQFTGTERRVRLEGEGYFEVAKNPAQPFIVESGNLTIEALGTTFNISRYPVQHRTEVVLLEGSVKITSPAIDKDVVLAPNQMLNLADDGTLLLCETKARMHAGWIQDNLVFDNDRLADIIIGMESWYRMDIQCPKAFAEKMRMSFTIGTESIQDILKAMSLVIPITWSVNDGVVTLIPSGS
jgi:ferric-dicitrate binding protein FerR (iron transport regulator)